jgi:hypothetical protein
MIRSLSMLALLGVFTLALGVSAADKPAKGGKTDVEGMVKSYDEKTMVLIVSTKEGTKKAAGETTEVQVTDKTKIEYVDITRKELQQLLIGYHVRVTLDPDAKDTAAAITVSESVVKMKKK